jgi:hypothetical protein
MECGKEDWNMDDQNKPSDLTRYELRLDRQTIRDFAAIAERAGCGIGSLIGAYCQRGIASELHSSFRDITEIRSRARPP